MTRNFMPHLSMFLLQTLTPPLFGMTMVKTGGGMKIVWAPAYPHN